MAIKAGTDNKRNVAIAVVLFCVLAYLAVTELMGPSTPAPTVAAPAHPATMRPPLGAAAGTTATMGNRAAAGPDAVKLPGTELDPALHLDKLAASESIEYAGSGRNIFSADSAPVVIEPALAAARPGPVAPPVYVPPPIPQPPAIDLRYFGYAAGQTGARKAFLVHGDDIFEAAAGDIVNHRYKVVSVDARSVQITDLSYNNTQTLPLVSN